MYDRKRKYAVGLMFLINIVVLLWVVFGYGLSWEVDDDPTMAAILAGAFGEPSAYIVYGNIVLGYLLKILYQLPGNIINWIIIFYYVAMFTSFVGIGYVFIKKGGAAYGSILYYSLLLLLCHGFYLTVNFTRVSGLVVAGGYLLFLYSITEETIKKWEKILIEVIGALLIIYGSMTRFMPFLMISAIVVGFFWDLFFKDWKKSKSMNLLGRKYGLIVIIVFFVMMIQGVSSYIYNSDSEWKAYTSYNDLRSQLLDYGVPKYDDFQNEYEAMGMTRNDVYSLSIWDFDDPDKFSEETLKKIVELREVKKDSMTIAVWSIKSMVKDIVKHPGSICLLELLVLCFLLSKKKLCVVWTLLVTAMEWATLYYLGRVLPRVTVVLFMGIVLYLAWALIADEEKSKTWIPYVGAWALLFCAACNCQITKDDLVRKTTYQNRVDVLGWFLELQETDNLYVWDVNEYRVLLDSYGTLMSMHKGISSNHVCLGGWLIRSPINEKILKEHDVANCYRALLDDHDVYLAGSYNLESKLTYLRENYNATANYSIYQSGVRDIYAFAYNFSDIKSGQYNFWLNDITLDQDKGHVILSGNTNAKQGQHIFLEMKSEDGVIRTFQSYEEFGGDSATWELRLPQVVFATAEQICIKLIVECEGVYQYSDSALTIAWP